MGNHKFKMKPAIIALLIVSAILQVQAIDTVVEETGNPEIYNGLVLGIGPGTLAVVIATVLAFVLCLFKDASETPNLIVGVAILLPLITLGIVLSLPVKSLSTDKEKEDQLPTDSYSANTLTFCM